MSVKHAKAQMKSQIKLNTCIPIFAKLKMTDAELAVYTLLYRDLPARIKSSEITVNASICFDSHETANQIDDEEVSDWLNQDNIERFKGYMIKGKKSQQVQSMLSKMHKTTLLVEIDLFLSLHPYTQIALLDVIAGYTEFNLKEKYTLLMHCIENLPILGKIVGVEIDKVPLNSDTVSRILLLLRSFSIQVPDGGLLVRGKHVFQLKTKKQFQIESYPALNLTEVFQWIKSLDDHNLDTARCFYYLYPVAKLLLTNEVIKGVIVTSTELEELYNKYDQACKPGHRF